MPKLLSYLKYRKDYEAKVIAKILWWGIKNILFGLKLPLSISVDVTNKCNLRCKHCYFFEQNHQKELSEEDLLKRIREVKRKYPSIIHASWVGGEPLLRKKVVEEGSKLFLINMVVTNGSIDLPKIKNCCFYVSIDGTKKYYEKMRGKGMYDKIKKNVNRDDIPVVIKCVLNKQNHNCIEDMLIEWKKTKVRGIVFDFYTPVKGIKENLWLNPQERDKVIDKLFEMKKKYGDFVTNKEAELKLMKSENAKKITSNCILPEACFCLDPVGKRKLPCVIGSKADCSKCGCIVPFYMEDMTRLYKKKSFIWIQSKLNKIFHSA